MLSRDPRDRIRRNTEMVDECWEWVKFRDPKGYGRTSYQGRQILSHRLSYIAFVGEIPADARVDHICGNPPCVNPDHLRLSTEMENRHNWVADRDSKTGFRGVTVNPDCRLEYAALVMARGRRFHLGRFSTPEEAGRAAAIGRYVLHERSERDRMDITREEAIELIQDDECRENLRSAFKEWSIA